MEMEDRSPSCSKEFILPLFVFSSHYNESILVNLVMWMGTGLKLALLWEKQV